MCSYVVTKLCQCSMDPSVRSERDSQRRASEPVDSWDADRDGVAVQKPRTPGTADWQGNVIAGDSVLLLRQPGRETRLSQRRARERPCREELSSQDRDNR